MAQTGSEDKGRDGDASIECIIHRVSVLPRVDWLAGWRIRQ